MSKNVKTITKILITILIIIGILLVLHNTDNAENKTYTFNCYGHTINITCADNHFYALAHDLLQNDLSSIDANGKWNVGTTVSAGNVNGSEHDGTYLMGGGSSATTKLIPNGYCGQEENGGSGVTGKIAYILDIDPNNIGLKYLNNKGEAKEKLVTRSEIADTETDKINSWDELNKFAYVLAEVYNHTDDKDYVWGENGKTRYLRGGIGKLRNYAANIENDLNNVLGFKPSLPIANVEDEQLNLSGTNTYHVRIYFVDLGGGQPRFIFKAEEATGKPIEFNIYKRKRASNGSASSTPVNEVTITVTPGDGVSSITTPTTMMSEDKDEKNGYFGKVKLIPDDNEGTCKVTIKEQQPSSHYKMPDTELTITYSNGKITNITPNIGNSDDNSKYIKLNYGIEAEPERVTSISLINDPRVTDLTIHKTNKKKTSDLEGAEFKVYFNNVESLKIGGTVQKISDLPNNEEGKKIGNITLKKVKKDDGSGYDSDRVTVSGLKTDSTGKIKLEEIKAINSKKYIIVKAQEMKAPEGYDLISGELWMLLKYNGTSWELVERTKENNELVGLTGDGQITNSLDTQYFEINSGARDAIIKDDRKIDTLNLLKIDKLDNTKKLQGATFTVTLENVKSVGEYSSGGTKSGKIIITGIKTDENGQLIINDLIVEDITKDVIITIQETGTPLAGEGYYYKAEALVKLKLTAASNYGTIIEEQDASNSSTATVSNNSINVTIANQPYITLSGMVWQDGQTGDKIVSDANGIKDDKERALGGVAVRLYKIVGNDDSIVKAGETNENNDDKNAYKNADGEGIVIYTQEDGTYEFKDVPKTNEGYRIIFGYDGINYQETNSFNFSSEKREDYGEDSKIETTPKEEYEYYKEIESTTRTTFNNTFKTIGENKAIKAGTNDATTIGYNYDVTSIEEKGYIANIGMDGTNLAVSAESQKGIHEKDFQMRARTPVYINTTANINCGLVKKVFDLALTTNVEKAEVTINGASTTYTDFSEPIIINEQPTSKSGIDDLYLYASDYNYRKSDYKTDNIENNVNPDNVEGSEIAGDELEVYVTYKVSLMNQTYKKANVDKFVYYYDGRYALIEDQSDLKGYKINSNSNNMIEFEKTDKNTYMEDQIDLTLKFKVNKYDLNGDGTIEIDLGEYGNAGEIIEYTTQEGGLIDKDSAPSNSKIIHTTQEGVVKVKNAKIEANDEDDSDQAKGLNIQIKEDKIRKISGTVFEDRKTGNKGQMDDGELGINEVVVQLIEIKKLYGQYYEYIWQEVSTDSNGYYEFTNFIPSGSNINSNEVQNYNYIVRFIYGDGAAYDLTPNRVKYNGQDYKSTKDINYKEVWYNNVMHNSTKEGVTKYDAKSSVARDNEARRLEVMAHSSTIDGKVGTALEIFTKNVQYSELTNIQKQNIAEYYNEIVKPQYDSVKDAVETEKPEEFLVAKRIKEIFGDPLPDVTAESMDEDIYNNIKRYVSYRTWMAAETSRINIQVDAADKTAIGSTELGSSAGSLEFDNINFGLVLRPETELILEKHITGLKVTPSGTGVQPIVDAKADINQILGDGDIVTSGVTTGLATIESDRGNRGFWKVETDIEEIIQGAQLEVEYTYVIKNKGEEDYLSIFLVNEYEKGKPTDYINLLKNKATEVKGNTKGNTYSYGNYLGQYYYLGEKDEELDKLVTTRVETLEQALNNEDLRYDSEVAGKHFASIGNAPKNVFDANGTLGIKDVEVLESKANDTSSFLEIKENDISKTLKLTTVLSSTGNGQLGTNLPSYIAEITSYSNAAGRRDMAIVPANLSYVHSDDSEITMNTHNEADEFWGESIIISKPTGEDKVTPMQIAIITISSLTVIGVGIILIKKIVLNK